MITVYAIMNTLLIYNNTIYRALSKHRYDRVMWYVNTAVNSYCCFFDVSPSDADYEKTLEHKDIDKTIERLQCAIDLMKSIKENRR